MCDGYNTPRRFAERIWPNSEGWKRHQNVGINGAASGVGMYKAGGSYLAKLRKAGLLALQMDTFTRIVRGKFREDIRTWYVISDLGRRALQDYDKFSTDGDA